MHVVGGARVAGCSKMSVGRPVLDDATRAPLAGQEEGRLLDTRWACCMLWVTMTIVTSVPISAMVSSIRRVEVGSRAEQGSSMSRTFGRTARARAMHSRCC